MILYESEMLVFWSCLMLRDTTRCMACQGDSEGWGAWQAAVKGLQRAGQDLETEQEQQGESLNN